VSARHEASEQLGRDGVGRLLLRFATPSIIGMVVNAMYNVVDRAYISRVVGHDALAGMTLTFPLMTVIFAFGMLVGSGTAALISISLGAGRRDDAEKCLGQAVALFLLIYVVFSPAALCFLDDILVALGGTEKMLPYARQYLRVILACNLVQHLGFGLNHAMRAEGFPKRALAAMLIGAALNAILDPIFIFPRFLDRGIRGAAEATILSQCVGTAWVLSHFLSPRSACRLRLKNIRVHPALAWRVAGIGLSPFFIQFVASIVGVTFNRSFLHYGGGKCELYMAAMGTILNITMLLFMPVFGLVHGMQPVVGYNHGAKNHERVRAAYLLTLKAAAVVGACGFMVCWAGAPWLALFFAPRPEHAELREIIPRFLRIMTLGFPVVGFSITTSNYFQSTGKITTALAMSLLRQVIILLPVLLVLPRFIGVAGIWWSTPVSDYASFCVASAFCWRELGRLRKLIGHG
jgi:putative MATE family efflux protein